MDYLDGPHQCWYAQLQKDERGNYIFDIDTARPSVVAASRYVARIVARKIVQELLTQSVTSDFGLDHKAISGILFEEVCLHLLANHPGQIDVNVRSLDGGRLLSTRGFVKHAKLQIGDNVTDSTVAPDGMMDVIRGRGNVEADILVRPKTSNFPGIDAVLLLRQEMHQNTKDGKRKRPGVEIFACSFQVTKSLELPVADAGAAVVRQIEDEMKDGKKSHHCLMFLVPEYNFKSFKKQRAKSNDHQARLNGVAQCVACITVTKRFDQR